MEGSTFPIWRRSGLARSNSIRPATTSRTPHPNRAQPDWKKGSHHPGICSDSVILLTCTNMCFARLWNSDPHTECTRARKKTEWMTSSNPAEDEFRVVNVILHPLGQQDSGEGTLHPVINSPTHSESSA